MNEYKEELKKKMDEYVHLIYNFTRDFPREERYGVISQIRRSSLSVILNFIEGYARIKLSPRLNFFEISFASLHESKYLLEFSLVEAYLSAENYHQGVELSDKIGAMLWTEIENLREILRQGRA